MQRPRRPEKEQEDIYIEAVRDNSSQREGLITAPSSHPRAAAFGPAARHPPTPCTPHPAVSPPTPRRASGPCHWLGQLGRALALREAAEPGSRACEAIRERSRLNSYFPPSAPHPPRQVFAKISR
ncbi:unnamed protein product [Pleuronectes platessa]|uniref:Uncharacterized protein n=1 Tax=Pleuronectes platessa TaxID=8262 RepID=A0A9N7VMZ5_PLEPL|nr:unnamed protein product [Pleuronectes platessa]